MIIESSVGSQFIQSLLNGLKSKSTKVIAHAIFNKPIRLPKRSAKDSIVGFAFFNSTPIMFSE